MTRMDAAPEISIVVVSHLHRGFIQACLDSIERARAETALEAFLIDNLSGDGTAEFVAERYPWVRLEHPARRQGFSANSNMGIRRSSGRYVLLLNPDTELQPGALRALAAFMDRRPRAGVCGARLLFPDGSTQPSCRRFPTLSSVLVRRTPLRWFMRGSSANARHLMLDLAGDASREVDWLLGACLFARREMIEDVGMLDEGYFLYVEDIDWCWRMHRKGWEVHWVPEARIMHRHLAVSDRKLLSWHSWVHFKGMLRFYRKHMGPKFLRPAEESTRSPSAL